ncbi:hypothetical protein [Novosphingobium sp.]|uniref:hypothetical protein n=1 Tax=Novosphingobium sp. TaxID=1874826 RepID=UPI002628A30C|nr:hypothetical protein [Novosphingobium sp.]
MGRFETIEQSLVAIAPGPARRAVLKTCKSIPTVVKLLKTAHLVGSIFDQCAMILVRRMGRARPRATGFLHRSVESGHSGSETGFRV